MVRALVLFLILPIAITAASSQDRPNIVVILADDLGSGDPGCYNPESRIPTPAINQLASEGMRFTDMHSPSAVCTPTRYGLLTGRYCWRTRLARWVLNGNSPLLIEKGRMTLASLLADAGYRTGCVGKWHLGLGDKKKTDYSKPLVPGPLTVGFHTFFGVPASLDMEPYVFVEDTGLHTPLTGKVPRSEHRRQDGGGFWRAGRAGEGFTHEGCLPQLTDRAVTFIRESAGGEKPFFLYFPMTAPHTPWVPTKDFIGRAKAGWYGDFVSQVDASVGAVMATLKDTKTASNTLFIFTSDNGAHWLPKDIKTYGHRANGFLRGQKADIHEGGHRVPFVVRWPGHVKEGTQSGALGCLTDVLATVAGVLGKDLPPDAGEDSFDLGPILSGTGTSSGRDHVIHHSGGGHFAIREGDWKHMPILGSGGFTNPRAPKPVKGGPPGQLYHLGRDPAEKKNVFHENPEVWKRLAKRLKDIIEAGRSRAVDE